MPETTDTIKAKLTPGEFVIRKEAVDMVGLPLLNKINDLPKEGGHSEIDKLIDMASLENMKPMYGGGEVKMGYGHGGMVKDSMMGMMGGGMAKKPMMGYAHGGMAKNLKPVPDDNPGLGKLPEQVRNRMGYMQEGGSVQDNTATDLMNLLALKELSEQSPEFSMFDADSRGGTILDDDILGISEGNFIPAAGIAKLVRPNFLRKKILGYTPDSPFKNSVLLDRETKAARSAMDKLLELQQKANTQMYGDKSIFYKDQKKELNKLADLARSYFGDDYVARRINFQEGGEVQDSLMGMMYGGMAKKKKGYGYQDGGEVDRGFLTEDDGVYNFKRVLSVPASQVGGKEGFRYYSGEASADDLQSARDIAGLLANEKMVTAPQDSIPFDMIDRFLKPEKKGLRAFLPFQEGGMVGPPAPQQNEIMQPGQTPPGTLMGPSEADIEQLRMMQAQGLQDSIQQSIVDKARNSLQLMQLLDSLGGETESIENIGPNKPFLDDGKIYLDQEELPSAEEPSKGDMIRMLMNAGMRVI